jgi:hypothetical protein
VSSRWGSTSDAGRDPRIFEVVAPFTVQPADRITYPAVAVRALRGPGEPESWTLVEWINVPGPGAPHRFLNDGLGDDWQLLVLVLAQGA